MTGRPRPKDTPKSEIVFDSTNKAKFIRAQLLAVPGLTLPKLIELATAAGVQDVKDNSIGKFSHELRERYGLKNLADLPRKGKGMELSMSAMIRLVTSQHPDFSKQDVVEYCAKDGLIISPALIEAIYPRKMKRVAKAAKAATGPADDSPDPNQHTGPRARIESPHAATRKERAKKPRMGDNLTAGGMKMGDEILRLEREVDELLQKADRFLDSAIVEDLRRARRYLSSSIIKTLG